MNIPGEVEGSDYRNDASYHENGDEYNHKCIIKNKLLFGQKYGQLLSSLLYGILASIFSILSIFYTFFFNSHDNQVTVGWNFMVFLLISGF